MSLGLILVIILVIALLGGFSGRFGGYGYGYGHGGIGILGVVLIVIVDEKGRPNRSAAPASPISASPIPDAPDTIFVKTEAIRLTPALEPAPVLATRQAPQRPIPLPRPRPAP